MRNWGKGGDSQASTVSAVYGSTVCLEYARNILGLGRRKGHADLDVMVCTCDPNTVEAEAGRSSLRLVWTAL